MFQVDATSRKPVYEQIVEQMEQFLLTGILSSGSQLPSVRSLSIQLSINPNTIQKAYSELDRRGMIYSVPGKGCFVSQDAFDILSAQKRKRITELEELMYELATVGISREEMIQCLDNAFKRKGDLNHD